jgi:hypothetical protein
LFKSKKFIIVAVLTAVVLAGTIGGVALAQDGNGGTPNPQARQGALLEKVAEIYEANTGTAIDAGELQKAFAEANEEIATQAREEMWQKLVDEGVITQEQLDEFKAWLEARPEMATDAFKEWLEARPDLGIGPFGNMDGERFGMMRDGVGQHGFGMPGGGFRGFCPPDEQPE